MVSYNDYTLTESQIHSIQKIVGAQRLSEYIAENGHEPEDVESLFYVTPEELEKYKRRFYVNEVSMSDIQLTNPENFFIHHASNDLWNVTIEQIATDKVKISAVSKSEQYHVECKELVIESLSHVHELTLKNNDVVSNIAGYEFRGCDRFPSTTYYESNIGSISQDDKKSINYQLNSISDITSYYNPFLDHLYLTINFQLHISDNDIQYITIGADRELIKRVDIYMSEENSYVTDSIPVIERPLNHNDVSLYPKETYLLSTQDRVIMKKEDEATYGHYDLLGNKLFDSDDLTYRDESIEIGSIYFEPYIEELRRYSGILFINKSSGFDNPDYCLDIYVQFRVRNGMRSYLTEQPVTSIIAYNKTLRMSDVSTSNNDIGGVKILDSYFSTRKSDDFVEEWYGDITDAVPVSINDIPTNSIIYYSNTSLTNKS